MTKEQKKKLNIDVNTFVGVSGLCLAAAGLVMISIPLAFIAVGSFLIWITEKADK